MSTTTSGISLEKLNLKKEEVLTLKKKLGIEGQKAQVVLALDYSGSMGSLYRSGTVQEVVEKLMPIAMAFDDNQEIDFYLFTNSYRKMKNITLQNLVGYVSSFFNASDLGATSYAPVLQAIVDDFTTKKGGLLGLSKKRIETLDYPVYVMFITDGNCDDKSETERVIREASKSGIFFQFVGIGYEQFMFLDKLDNLTGRALDNANFFKIQNIGMENDSSLYAKLLNEFPTWIPQARAKGMIK